MVTASSSDISALLRSGQVVEIGSRHEKSPAAPKTAHLVLAFTAIYLIWGSTYLAIRYAVESIPPLLMMGIRHLTAGALLYAWLRGKSTPAPLKIHWKHAIVAGAFFFLGAHGSLAWAEQRVPSGLAALLSATLPLWIVLLTRIKNTEGKLSGRVIGGLLLGFSGVALLIGPDAFRSNSGLSLLGAGGVLFGALSWGIGTIYTQHSKLPSSAALSAAMQMIAGGLTLIGAGLLVGEPSHLSTITSKSVLSLAYLIVFGSIIAFSAFTWLHQVSSPTRNSTYAYVNPAVAVFLGWFLAGEAIGLRTIIATVVILISVALVNRRPTDSVARKPVHNEGRQDFRERRLSTGD
jgi:drug/metabolite transporter (DMT)-like permease